MSKTPVRRPRDTTDPSADASEVTPSNSLDLPDGPCVALYVGSSGDLTVTMLGGTVVTFVAVQGFCPLQVRRVHATGTDADDIVALY